MTLEPLLICPIKMSMDTGVESGGDVADVSGKDAAVIMDTVFRAGGDVVPVSGIGCADDQGYGVPV